MHTRLSQMCYKFANLFLSPWLYTYIHECFYRDNKNKQFRTADHMTSRVIVLPTALKRAACARWNINHRARVYKYSIFFFFFFYRRSMRIWLAICLPTTITRRKTNGFSAEKGFIVSLPVEFMERARCIVHKLMSATNADESAEV